MNAKNSRKKAEKQKKVSIIDLYGEKFNELKEKGLFNPKYDTGDKVFISTYEVTKPTHQQRGGRLVRVRYEEERRYLAKEVIVESYIVPHISELSFMYDCLTRNKNFDVKYKAKSGMYFRESDVFNDIASAEADAKAKGIEYKESCDFASMCR